MNEKILIVEDDKVVRDGLVDLFVFHGFAVTTAGDGETALRLFEGGRFDLLLVDLMLPRRDGFSLCNAVRERDGQTAIIVLTARTDDESICKGFTLGVDDYVTKPFSMHELVLRVRAVLRRTHRPADVNRAFLLGDQLRLEPLALRATRLDGSGAVALTKREMDLLVCLKNSPGKPVSRAQLLHVVWGHRVGSTVETRTVDIHVTKLRRKLESDPSAPAFLVTVRAEGYQLCAVRDAD